MKAVHSISINILKNFQESLLDLFSLNVTRKIMRLKENRFMPQWMTLQITNQYGLKNLYRLWKKWQKMGMMICWVLLCQLDHINLHNWINCICNNDYQSINILLALCMGSCCQQSSVTSYKLLLYMGPLNIIHNIPWP